MFNSAEGSHLLCFMLLQCLQTCKSKSFMLHSIKGFLEKLKALLRRWSESSRLPPPPLPKCNPVTIQVVTRTIPTYIAILMEFTRNCLVCFARSPNAFLLLVCLFVCFVLFFVVFCFCFLLLLFFHHYLDLV